MDAVDADSYITLSFGLFALASLGAIVFFVGRANAISMALVGWWVFFVGTMLIAAPGTISGSEDVVGWASVTGAAALIGLIAGGWLGSNVGRPRTSPAFLVGCAIASALVGAAMILVFWLLSYVSCGGRVSPEHLRRGLETDTTFCAANGVLGEWAVVYVACFVVLLLLTARRARRDATADARVQHTSFTSTS